MVACVNRSPVDIAHSTKANFKPESHKKQCANRTIAQKLKTKIKQNNILFIYRFEQYIAVQINNNVIPYLNQAQNVSLTSQAKCRTRHYTLTTVLSK